MKHIYPIHSREAASAYEASILRDDPEQTAAAVIAAGGAIGRALYADYQEIQPWPVSPCILVLAGKGLNTADAFVACEALAADVPDLRVQVVTTFDKSEFSPLTSQVYERLQSRLAESLSLMSAEAFLDAQPTPVDVIIDGILGLGFVPPMREGTSALLERVNKQENVRMRVAIDLPSGLGETADPNTFVADITYVPGVAKAPCFDSRNASVCGRLRFLEVEPFLDQPIDEGHRSFVLSSKSHLSLNRIRPSVSDKRSFGHNLVLAGSSGMPGAALMAVKGALQSGAGLVTALTPASISLEIASAVPEAVWRPLPVTSDGGIDVEAVRIISNLSSRGDAILIGPGMIMDRATVFAVCRIIRETPLALVVDASALTQDVVGAVLGRPLTAGPVIITPHRGEYARMLGPKEDPDDLDVLMAFSSKYRAITVLKGSPTLVCDGERIIFCPTGGPVLSRGGTGDILSGMILSLLSRNSTDPLGCALKALSWLGAAGDSLARERGAIAVRTTELLDYLSPSLRD